MNRKTAKKIKKPSRKKLVKELDRVFSLFIRQRDKKCVQCGKVEQLTCGHLLTRAKYSVRWNEGNAFGQCAGENMKHEFQPEHYTLWYINKFGLQSYEQLVTDSNKLSKFTNSDLQEKINYYTKQIEKERE